MLYPATCVRLRYGPRCPWRLAGFLGGMVTCAPRTPGRPGYFQGRIMARTCLRQSAPTPLNALFRQRAALSLPRHRIPGHSGCRNVDRLAIGLASRLCLRTRLTLIRLALIRKPWPCGEGGSRPLCRYSYLHLRFHGLQHRSRRAFSAHGMLPYRIPKKGKPASSASRLYPIIIHAAPLD